MKNRRWNTGSVPPPTDDISEGDRLAHAMAILIEENPYDEGHDPACNLAHGMELGLQAMLLHPEWALLVAQRTAQTFPMTEMVNRLVELMPVVDYDGKNPP